MDSAIHLLNNWGLEAKNVAPHPVAYTRLKVFSLDIFDKLVGFY